MVIIEMWRQDNLYKNTLDHFDFHIQSAKMIARYLKMMLTLQKYPSNTICILRWRNLGCDPFHKLMNIFTIVELKCKNEDVKYSLIHLFASQTVFSTKSDHKKCGSSPGVFWSVTTA